MSKLIDLTGKRFGRLTVEGRAENRSGHTAWNCKCDCGNTCVVQSWNLTHNHSKSCGCLQSELFSEKHGLRNNRIYGAWNMMKQRCFNRNGKHYPRWGGRGITVYPAWIDDFQAFYDYVSKLEHFGEEGYTLDRIDNNGNYEPGNLRWADNKTQAQNKRNNHIVEYNGVEMTLSQAAELSGISYSALWRRYKHGDTGEYLFRPVR